ncbi:hypothetical protein [Sphingomonas lenta]|uniref:Uncharacterized protein n=1 Tax=Sphingomonas lenta TaxID=1141887 RepID=A0A2A2SJM9_9SPHN|nr:hypothetical protein [Sphingomonas lenta]PAX09433.1 hypothetical protein CKY28_01370 [Sphingomonas lenta]
MSLSRTAVAALLAVGAAASPAQAQFFLKSKSLAGQPVRGDEPGVLAAPLPNAKPEELRAGLVWTMRAALNVAALQCQFEPTLTTVRNYNALLLDHRDELKKSFDTLTGYFARTARSKADGQKALDQFGTRTYSSFSSVSGQFGFCQTAHAIGRDANFTPRGHFGEFSETRIQELRNSLVPFGEQRFVWVSDLSRLTVSRPRLDPVCWDKKGNWREKKCGPAGWPTPAAVAMAAR